MPSDSPSCGGIFDLDAKRETLRQLEERMAAPGFWNDQQQAQAVVQQVKAAKGWVDPFDNISGRVASARELDESLGILPELTRALGLRHGSVPPPYETSRPAVAADGLSA